MTKPMPEKESLPQVTFNQVAKHPVTYALLVVVSLLWFVAYMFKDSSGRVNENCEQEKKELRVDLANERRRNDDLVQALLVKNGIISEIKKTTDSLVRQRVGNEAKRIIQ